VKLLKVTPVLFVLGFFVTLLVAFTIFPVNSGTTPRGTGIKAKPREVSTLHDDLFLVLWKDGGEIKGIFTSEEKAKKYIEVTQNESIYEIKVFSYGSPNE
jgi:hypothetical protein